MDINEAIRFLDPETTAEAIAEVEYYGGFSGKDKAIQKINESCDVAVAIMRGYQKMCDILETAGVSLDNSKCGCAEKVIQNLARVKEDVSGEISNISEIYNEDEREI